MLWLAVRRRLIAMLRSPTVTQTVAETLTIRHTSAPQAIQWRPSVSTKLSATPRHGDPASTAHLGRLFQSGRNPIEHPQQLPKLYKNAMFRSDHTIILTVSADGLSDMRVLLILILLLQGLASTSDVHAMLHPDEVAHVANVDHDHTVKKNHSEAAKEAKSDTKHCHMHCCHCHGGSLGILEQVAVEIPFSAATISLSNVDLTILLSDKHPPYRPPAFTI